MDPQEAALRSGRRPGEEGWGCDREDWYGTLTTDAGGLGFSGRLATVPGSYQLFYQEMARAILGRARCRFRPREARNTIWIIECAHNSSRQGRVVTVH